MKVISRLIGFTIIVYYAAKLGYLQRLETFINGQTTQEVSSTHVQIAKEPSASPSPTPFARPQKVSAPKSPEAIYLVKALQLPAGIVPVGAILKVNDVSGETYSVEWRGYNFRVSKDDTTEDRDYASRKVGMIASEIEAKKKQQLADDLARASEAQNRADRERHFSQSLSLLHPQASAGRPSYSVRGGYQNEPSSSSYTSQTRQNYNSRSAVLSADIAALKAAQVENQRKFNNNNHSVPHYFENSAIRQRQINARENELRLLNK